MNRHQSNPFLAGWEECEGSTSAVGGAFDVDATARDNGPGEQGSQEATNHRRHSSSQADVAGNPFGAQRAAADRRLYHRNMSSFEAASLQLEHHQQQMKENGTTQLSAEQTDLIAKMTADFQSAILSNEQDLADDAGLAVNPFDPFETIMDDDVSLASPGKSLPSAIATFEEDAARTCDSQSARQQINFTGTQKQAGAQTAHDSIDEDEDELVSTPVRNIKSSSPQAIVASDNKLDSSAEPNDASTARDDRVTPDEIIDSHQAARDAEEQWTTDSISKASLFASLLATAESGANQIAANEAKPDTESGSAADELGAVPVSPLNNQPTHVIKGASGSESTGGRPIGYFDPFETVIDRDALTSLMNDPAAASTTPSKSTEDTNSDGGALADESRTSAGSLLSHPSEVRQTSGEQIAESASIETVVEQPPASGQLSDQASLASDQPLPAQANNNALGSLAQQEVAQSAASPRIVAPSKRPARTRHKASFQEDSSDSSEEDDRIQIVIKARDLSKLDAQSSAPTIVPLLPPPPSKSSMKQARERGKVEDMPSPIMGYKSRTERKARRARRKSEESDSGETESADEVLVMKDPTLKAELGTTKSGPTLDKEPDDEAADHDETGKFVIPLVRDSDEDGEYAKPDTPLYDDDTSYVLEEFPARYEGTGWEMMLRYPPKKKLTSNRFWKRIFVRLAEVPLGPDSKHRPQASDSQQTCIALQIFDKPDDKKPMQEIPIQATYTVSEISSQQFDQFGKIFTIKLQYIFYKERVGVRQGQLARFIHSGHIGTSTTSGGHGVDPISIGAIKRMGAPIEHSPQISQIIKLGCTRYDDIRQFKNCLEDYLFKMPIHRDRALSTYKTEEVQMAVRDETYLELNQIGQTVRQLARVRLFFLSFLNGMPTVEVGVNDIHRQGREVVGRMDILPVVTEEWIRLEDWELHPTVDRESFELPDKRMISLVPPDATFFELLRFRVRPPRNRELPLQISANMSVTRTKVSINCEVMVPGCVSRKHGQIPCEDIAIKVTIPECWIYFFREEKHFRLGSKKSVNRRPGKVKGIERFLGGGGGLQDFKDDSSLIEVTSGQAKYEHHHKAIVWRAARWPKETQSAYVQNTMKIRLPLTAYDEMPESFYEYVHVEYTMPATTVSHTTLRSISVNPCDDEPPEKYVKYSARYEYKVKVRLSVNLSNKPGEPQQSIPEASPIVIMKQQDKQDDLQKEEDSDDDDDDDDEGADQVEASGDLADDGQ